MSRQLKCGLVENAAEDRALNILLRQACHGQAVTDGIDDVVLILSRTTPVRSNQNQCLFCIRARIGCDA